MGAWLPCFPTHRHPSGARENVALRPTTCPLCLPRILRSVNTDERRAKPCESCDTAWERLKGSPPGKFERLNLASHRRASLPGWGTLPTLANHGIISEGAYHGKNASPISKTIGDPGAITRLPVLRGPRCQEWRSKLRLSQRRSGSLTGLAYGPMPGRRLKRALSATAPVSELESSV